jgi:hypothetical protein
VDRHRVGHAIELRWQRLGAGRHQEDVCELLTLDATPGNGHCLRMSVDSDGERVEIAGSSGYREAAVTGTEVHDHAPVATREGSELAGVEV